MSLEQLQKNISQWAMMQQAEMVCAKEDSVLVQGLDNGAFCFFLSALLKNIKGRLVIVVPTEQDIARTVSDIQTAGFQTSVLPWWGNIAYRSLAKNSTIFAERAHALLTMAEDPNAILVMPLRSFMTAVPPCSYTKTLSLSLFSGQAMRPDELAKKLTQAGYLRVSKVSVRGEFAMRGEVIDIAPMYDNIQDQAYRIQFDFDTIEKIRAFHIFTQDSRETLDTLTIAPTKEVLWDNTRLEILLENLKSIENRFCSEKERPDFIAEILEKQSFNNEELFFSLAFENPSSILDYLDKDDTVIFTDFLRIKNSSEVIVKEYETLYKKAKGAIEHYTDASDTSPIVSPKGFLCSFEELLGKIKKAIYLQNIGENLDTIKTKLKLPIDSPKSFFGNIMYLKETLTSLLDDGWKVYIFAESENQSLRIKSFLQDFTLDILPYSLSSGFSIPDLKILVINEHEIFGRRRRIPHSVKQAQSSVIDVFIDLSVGDYVVHVNYGIGQFRGIERVSTMGSERDYIELLYANEQQVFIPIEQADLVQKYLGNEGKPPRLDTIGSKAWEARKNKVKKSVEDLAGKLLTLYSKRKLATGFSFPPDDEWQIAFEAAFPYEETEDQLTCIAEVKADMESDEPMDRLICGDVGYGKTEVAMRACFKASMAGKQTAFLAPTTVLAEQHYQTLLERFKNFPIKIERLSRFLTKMEQKKVLHRLANGEVDIVVGTHRIIQKDVVFKDLGLLVIDEEQRFGVKDKERLKNMRNNVDVLSMSATPIPRTLHMSLLKIRKMSLITTPPQNRKPVETSIHEWNMDLVCKAIRTEIERGGQVFYLHNRIESLEEIQFMLQKAMPEVLFIVAHGQMSGDEIEEIFTRFNAGGFHVLISTTIIENGIDIPNANTIIIDRADMYGVSQLYQLRGRVGRSDKNAYAYLMYPKGKVLSEISVKRLQTISDFTELGSGFKIAMKDMEIRGVGNLLGRQQSGNIYSIGFDMYLHLLDTAVRELENENYVPEMEPLVELEYSGFIPDSYITAEDTKMEIYKKIAGVRTDADFDHLVSTLLDRFGTAPAEVESLLALAEIKILCKKLCITSLKEHSGTCAIEFAQVTHISIDKLLKAIRQSAGKISLDAQRPNRILLQTGSIGLKEKSEFIKEQLGQLV